MQGIVIKQRQGLWTLETSTGVHWAGASLDSVVKQALTNNPGSSDAIAATVGAALGALFKRIPDTGSGQIAHGVAGA